MAAKDPSAVSPDTSPAAPVNSGKPESADFLRTLIRQHVSEQRYPAVVTRFPPEPNGYLHIGHAKSVATNFGLGAEFAGRTHLRFDDTNPTTEDTEFVDSIQADIQWLGYEWGDNLFFASDYFQRLYDFAVDLIKQGKAYVCDLNEEDMRTGRGTVTEAGTHSPFRDRSVEENLDLFARMRAGEFDDGQHTLRAKIDMANPNMKMRDPPIYRIRKAHHHRTGDAWPIYPMYDFAHCLSDAIEGITHSICTLEFENNRELYDWILDQLFEEPRPHQYEFAKLQINYTIMSKRNLKQLVDSGVVSGWDDPRMPTLRGLRRRGVTPECLRKFATDVGLAKANSVVDMAQLDFAIRDDLNHKAPRVMAILEPLRVVLENYPEGKQESFDAPYWPHDVPKEGTRPVPFARELYIEKTDFLEDAPSKWHRLAPGAEVRLRSAYYITCNEVVKDDAGEVVELRCTYDPQSRGGSSPDGRKVRGTIHWLAAAQALPAEIRVYDRLISQPQTDPDKPIAEQINPESLRVCHGFVEPSLAAVEPGERFQFERQGYYCTDLDSAKGALVFNRTIGLRDSWAKQSGKSEGSTAKDAKPAKGKKRKQAEAPKPKKPREGVDEAILARYSKDGVGDDAAELLASRADLATFFDAASTVCTDPKELSLWLVNVLLGEAKEIPLDQLKLDAAGFGELVQLVVDGAISGRVGKDLLPELLKNGGSAKALVKSKGLEQLSDDASLLPLVQQAVQANPKQLEAYRGGKDSLFGFFVGQVMRLSGGKANPSKVNELLKKELG